ncbi:MAG: class I SAM-dependent methyltransferase [Anaerolineae bacterium]
MMYDDLSTNYDRFIDWEGRLRSELSFIEEQLQSVNACRVLDAACGSGMHAIALAEKGYEVVGTDLNAEMIARARGNAGDAGSEARFRVAGFGELAQVLDVGEDGFDALLCLGNSLPHVLTPEELIATLADFFACLRPGGLLLIQNRNFDMVLADRERWMGPRSHREGNKEWLFLRFYDFEPHERLCFNLVTLRREGDDDWEQQVTSTRLWALRQETVLDALAETGYKAVTCYGDIRGAPFDADSSPNLIVTAHCPA